MGLERWKRVVAACERSFEECVEALRWFASEMCPDRSECEEPRGRGGLARRYEWVERLLHEGVPDGRSRLILYVISRYLLNVKGLSEEDAFTAIKDFLRASCERHGDCSKIYDSWIRNVLRHVKRGGWKPWSLDRMRKEDPELYKIVEAVLGGG